MRIIHIVHGKCNPKEHNGISRVVYYLNKYEKLAGMNSEIWAVVDDAKQPYDKVRDEFVTVKCFPRVKLFGKKDIVNKLIEEKESIDLVHFHMIWFYDKNIIADALVKNDIPYIVTTHGTYSNPRVYKGKYGIVRKLYELDFLKKAKGIHIITREEGTKLRMYGYSGPVFLGYNGIDESEIPEKRNNDFFSKKPYANRIKIGWVGVLREDKNIASLIESFKFIPREIMNNLVFIFIGPDWKGNKSKYIEMANNLNCKDNVDFVGPLYDKDKYDAIESLDFYIQPSFSEVLSLAIPDAMACKKPIITTTGCGYNYLIQDYKFGLLCEPYPYDISLAILDMLSRKNEWANMGNNGLLCVTEQLNWKSISQTIIEGYKRILNESNYRKK